MSTKAPTNSAQPPAYPPVTADRWYESMIIQTASPLDATKVIDRPGENNGFRWSELFRMWSDTTHLSARLGMVHGVFKDIDRSDLSEAWKFCLRMANGHGFVSADRAERKYDKLTDMAATAVFSALPTEPDNMARALLDPTTFKTLMWFMDPKWCKRDNLTGSLHESQGEKIRQFLQLLVELHIGDGLSRVVEDSHLPRIREMLTANWPMLIGILYETGHLDRVLIYDTNPAFAEALRRRILADPVHVRRRKSETEAPKMTLPVSLKDALMRSGSLWQIHGISVLAGWCEELGLPLDFDAPAVIPA